MTYYCQLKSSVNLIGGFGVYFPEFPSCFSQGNSLEQSLERAKEALNGYIKFLLDENEDIPEPQKYTGEGFYPIELDCCLVRRILEAQRIRELQSHS